MLTVLTDRDRLPFVIDAADFDVVSRYAWRINQDGYPEASPAAARENEANVRDGAGSAGGGPAAGDVGVSGCALVREGRRCGRPATTVCGLCSEPACAEHGVPAHHFGPIAKAGFDSDMDALRRCDACVLVLPCGKSAHLELGWAAGAGKATAVLMLGPDEPELMYRMLGWICTDVGELLGFLRQRENALLQRKREARG